MFPWSYEDATRCAVLAARRGGRGPEANEWKFPRELHATKSSEKAVPKNCSDRYEAGYYGLVHTKHVRQQPCGNTESHYRPG